jgi:hypothetical protein
MPRYKNTTRQPLPLLLLNAEGISYTALVAPKTVIDIEPNQATPAVANLVSNGTLLLLPPPPVPKKADNAPTNKEG